MLGLSSELVEECVVLEPNECKKVFPASPVASSLLVGGPSDSVVGGDKRSREVILEEIALGTGLMTKLGGS